MIHFRSDLNNSYSKFIEGTGTIIFQGGSISLYKWRNMVHDKIRSYFNEAGNKLNFDNYSAPGLDSAWASFTFDDIVLSKCLPDLFFIDWCVNDQSNFHVMRTMEGLIRKALKANPYMDIVVIYFPQKQFFEKYRNNEDIRTIMEHEQILKHYNISSINVSTEIFRLLEEKVFSVEDILIDNSHPTELGCKIYSDYINKFLELAWSDFDMCNLHSKPHYLPEPLFENNTENSQFIDINDLGWIKKPREIPQKTPITLPATLRKHYNNELYIYEPKAPNETLTFSFSGTIIGIGLIIGPDSGILEYSFDDGDFIKRDTYDKLCTYDIGERFKYITIPPPSYTLKKGYHTCKLRASYDKNENSAGHAIRIVVIYSA
jgi:sialidase-1